MADEQRPPYQYEPLPPGKWIRVLHLAPGTSKDDICVELCPVTLDDSPMYEAMSYCWGDENDRREIQCSGTIVSITASLSRGLSKFRHQHEPRIVWADALCINQGDNEEKGSQVNFMGEIYDKAAAVLVYLGEALNDDAGVVFDLIQDFNEYIVEQHEAMSEHPPPGLPEFLNGLPPTPADHVLMEPSRWQAAANLFAVPYFTRTWTLQETGLATRATAYYGSCTILWSQMIQFAVSVNMVVDLPPQPMNIRTVSIMNTWANIWCSFGKTNSWLTETLPLSLYTEVYALGGPLASFLTVLVAARGFQATNTRDHIYGFLGHPAARLPDGKMILEADYSRPLDELWRVVASRLVHGTQSLECMLYVQHGNLQEMEKDSWIPKWRNHDHTIADLTLRSYEAGTFSKKKVMIDYQEPVGSELRLSHLDIDNIRLITPLIGRREGHQVVFHLHPQIHNGSDIPNMSDQHALESMWYLVNQAHSSLYENSALALITTLSGGQYRPEKSAIPDFLALIQHTCPPEFCQQMLSALPPEDDSMRRPEAWWRYLRFGNICTGRRFFVTEKGYFGLAPHFADEGDIVSVFFGARVLYILRPAESKGSELNRFKLVGPAYLHGGMGSELLVDWEQGRKKAEEIVLV